MQFISCELPLGGFLQVSPVELTFSSHIFLEYFLIKGCFVFSSVMTDNFVVHSILVGSYFLSEVESTFQAILAKVSLTIYCCF